MTKGLDTILPHFFVTFKFLKKITASGIIKFLLKELVNKGS